VSFPLHPVPPSDFAISQACGHWHYGPSDAPDVDEEMRPYRQLALAVLGEQIRAASHNPGGWLQWRREPGYQFWCDVTGLDADALFTAVMRRLCAGDVALRREAITRKAGKRGPQTAAAKALARVKARAAWARRKAVAHG
jgi:hypothetical protein